MRGRRLVETSEKAFFIEKSGPQQGSPFPQPTFLLL
jgi:hypothetical protein